jgi:hypothetical protein
MVCWSAKLMRLGDASRAELVPSEAARAASQARVPGSVSRRCVGVQTGSSGRSVGATTRKGRPTMNALRHLPRFRVGASIG